MNAFEFNSNPYSEGEDMSAPYQMEELRSFNNANNILEEVWISLPTPNTTKKVLMSQPTSSHIPAAIINQASNAVF